jgi:hypothetical protein
LETGLSTPEVSGLSDCLPFPSFPISAFSISAFAWQLRRAVLAEETNGAHAKRQQQQGARHCIDGYPGCVLVFDYAS